MYDTGAAWTETPNSGVIYGGDNTAKLTVLTFKVLVGQMIRQVIIHCHIMWHMQ